MDLFGPLPGPELNMGKGQELYKLAKTMIPGGAQLLSKRPEMFLPDQWPAYYRRASGCSVWDLDGRELLDFGYMGIGSCVLGYADPDVTDAVVEAVRSGGMCTLNAPEEVELAQLLLRLHPWAEMVRYARTGGEAMSIAVRIARAATRKDVILFCGYHGWHDWYLAANLSRDEALDGHLLPGLQPLGVPRELEGTALPFHYNDLGEFEALVEAHRGRIAAVVMEPLRNFQPAAGFLPAIRRVCTEQGIALVIDEITAGFRLNLGGAHLVHGIEPDIAVFGKAISNGTPMAAIVGKAKFLDAAQESFISSTYWTDRTGPAAALATLRKMERLDTASHLERIGTMVLAGWEVAAARAGLPLSTGGSKGLPHFSFEIPEGALAAKTLFIQEMLRRGYLVTTACYVSLAHTEDLTRGYLAACEEVFGIVAEALRRGDVPSLLEGPVCHAGFARLS